MLVSIITPVAPYHQHLMARAAAQVEAQTIRCAFIPVVDHDRRGPGWARNEGVRLARTPFIAFLDADDLLCTDFAERMLEVWKPRHYVYSDFMMSGAVVRMADHSNLRDDDRHHTVNCLMRRETFLALGGFDETRNLEDTRFWAKCQASGVCGIRCPYPLMEYTGDGQRSADARRNPQWVKDYWQIFREYPNMCDCESVTPMNQPQNQQQNGDVLVVAMWGGNRTMYGAATGRTYPRMGNFMQYWMNPQDAAARPQLFRIVPEITAEVEPDFDVVTALAKAKLEVQETAAVAQPESEPVKSEPNRRQSSRRRSAKTAKVTV